MTSTVWVWVALIAAVGAVGTATGDKTHPCGSHADYVKEAVRLQAAIDECVEVQGCTVTAIDIYRLRETERSRDKHCRVNE